MANRILISVQEGLENPSFLEQIEPFMQKAMHKLHFDNEEVSILFCNNEYIRSLNNNYRQIDSATDVLSFENDYVYNEDGFDWKQIGDIVISVEMIEENATYFGTSCNAELKRLLVHGILHLNGMDHGQEHLEIDKAPKCEMLVLQENILQQLLDEILIK